MNEAHILKTAGELKVQPRQVTATPKLFAEGATVPFIARYRKEATGSLDEVAITSIRERLLSLAELDQRREPATSNALLPHAHSRTQVAASDSSQKAKKWENRALHQGLQLEQALQANMVQSR